MSPKVQESIEMEKLEKEEKEEKEISKDAAIKEVK